MALTAPVARALAERNSEPTLRMQGRAPFVTDNGNHIIDARFPRGIDDARGTDTWLNTLPGGLYSSVANAFIADILPAEWRAVAFGLISATWGVGLATGPLVNLIPFKGYTIPMIVSMCSSSCCFILRCGEENVGITAFFAFCAPDLDHTQ